MLILWGFAAASVISIAWGRCGIVPPPLPSSPVPGGEKWGRGVIILTGRGRRETAGKLRHMCWLPKLLWLDIPCLPAGFKMITPYCAQVIILSALTHNGGNGSGGVRMAKAPIVDHS